MAGSPLGVLATQMLSLAEGTELRTMLFTLADQPSPSTCLTGPIADETALAAKKGSWEKSAIAATCATNPEVLASLAKDPRLNVRRAVAANEHISAETREYLFRFGMAKCDVEIVASTLLGVAPRVVLAELREHGATMRPPWNLFAQALCHTGDTDLVLEAWDLGIFSMFDAIVTNVDAGKVPGLSIEDLIAATPRLPDVVERVHMAAIRHRPVFDVATAEMLITHRSTFNRSDRNSLYGSSRTFEPTAALMLVATGVDELVIFVSRAAKLDAECITKILESGISDALETIVRIRVRLLDKAQLTILVSRLDQECSSYTPAAVLEARHGDLDKSQRVALLRLGDVKLTLLWLDGHFGGPRPGEFTALVADPGRSFAHSLHARPYATGLLAVANAVAPAYHTVLAGPLAAEVVEALGAAFITHVRFYEECRIYMAKRFTEAFGSDVELWRTALALVLDWESSLTDLIGTICDISGHPAPQSASPPAPLVAITITDQLALAI